MIIGIVGAPNKGKSTFFSAATMVDAQIADYPFTTIDPNKGTAYARSECPHVVLGLQKCDARNSKCEHGARLIPINVIDVAGLVPDAHLGKGMGFEFLGDLAQAQALIQVVDASARTDMWGRRVENADVCEEARMLRQEIDFWIMAVLEKNWAKIKGRDIGQVGVALSGINASLAQCEAAAKQCGLQAAKIEWSEQQRLEFCRALGRMCKPIAIAANKCDMRGSMENVGKLKECCAGMLVVPTFAAGELALRKAAAAGKIKYVPGDADFEECAPMDQRQQDALASIRKTMQGNGGLGTGVQRIVDAAVFGMLGLVDVYPVEDENRYCDGAGRVLPDALLMGKGSTVFDLAGKVHTDLQGRFVGAVDARSKRRVGKEAGLSKGDVIRIIAGR